MAVGDVYRLAVLGTANSVDTFVNVLHYRQTIAASGGVVGAEALAEAWRTDCLPAYQAIMSNGFQFQSLVVRQVTGGSEEFEQGLTETGTGGASSAFLPYQSAAIISWRTGLAGRSKRGRTYLFPAVEEDQEAGLLSSTYVGEMNDIIDAWPTAASLVTGASFELVIWSPTLLSAQEVTTGIAQQIIGTQRRRRAGVGS